MIKSLIPSLIMSLTCSIGLAGGLSAPFGFESTTTLPQGVRKVQFSGFTTEALNRYNDSGNPEALGASLNTQLTFGQLAQSLPTPTQQQSFLGYISSHGFSETETAGSTTGFVSARATVSVPVFAYGITKNWSIGIAIPVVYSNTYIDTGFVRSSRAQQFFSQILAQDTGRNQASDAALALQDPVGIQSQSLGYDAPEGETQTRMGDIRIVNKVRLAKTRDYAFALKPSLTLPTGEPASINKLVDVASGDGQWDLGLGLVGEIFLGSQWTLTGYLDYTAQLQSTQAKRVPVTSASPLSADIDENVNEDLGDTVTASVGVIYEIDGLEGVSLASAYSYLAKGQDTYSGTAYSSERYDWLSQNTEQTMQTAQIGVGYSTLSLYKKKRFSIPLESTLNYTSVLSGNNVIRESVASFDIALYF